VSLEHLLQLRPIDLLIKDHLILNLREKIDTARPLLLLLSGVAPERCGLRVLLVLELPWLEQRIEHHREGIVDHLRDNAGEEGTRDLQAGVRVRFDQVHAELLVYHEVVAKQLKTVFHSVRVYF
jgi:hypothetical protein